MSSGLAVGRSPGRGFLEWLEFVKSNPDFDVAGLMRRAIPGASEAVAQAYGAPFPDARYKAGVRRFPQLVAITPDMPGAVPAQQAASFWSNEWNGPTFMAIGAKDPVLGPQTMSWMRSVIRGCPEPLVLENEGHFVQESGEIVARAALSAFGKASGSQPEIKGIHHG